jgi:serine/threonine protein kinase
VKIINCGSGIHAREVVGVNALQKLPREWFAYTNLDLIFSAHKSREIDVVLVAPDRVMLIDLKDWKGPISSSNGNWLNGDRNLGASPVQKMLQNVRDLLPLMTAHIKQHSNGKRPKVPTIQGFVVVTSKADFSGLDTNERKRVFQIDDFVKKVADPKKRVAAFGPAFGYFVSNSLHQEPWKRITSGFFNAGSGVVEPGRRLYGNYVAQSEAATFEHPRKVYSEYEVEDRNSATTFGTLRLWDFTQADTRFQNEDGRNEIAGREREVFGFIRELGTDAEQALLGLVADDPERGVKFWEVYDRRKRLKRFRDWIVSDGNKLNTDDKIEVGRQIISKLESLHRIEVSHLDIGSHSLWIERPSTIRISHLMAARIPDVKSLGTDRYQFLSSAILPEDILDIEDAHSMPKDVFLVGVLLHHLFFGKPPSASEGQPAEWDASIDPLREYGALHSWFETSLALDPSDRFPSAVEALSAFNRSTEARPTRAEINSGLENFSGKYASQRALLRAYPETELLEENAEVEQWKSRVDGKTFLVKLWKSVSWNNSQREGAKILDFLNRAAEYSKRDFDSFVSVKEVAWLGDAIAIVQEFVDGRVLREFIEDDQTIEGLRGLILTVASKLTKAVSDFHALGMTHGDLKPDNIVLKDGDVVEPVIIDSLDFAPQADGEICTSRYSPSQGGRFERDRFATVEIVKELLDPIASEFDDIEIAIGDLKKCQTGDLANTTLSPVLEILSGLIETEETVEVKKIVLKSPGFEQHAFVSDEGRFHVRFHPVRSRFMVRGLCEELVIDCDLEARPTSVFRRSIEQTKIERVALHEIAVFDGEIEIEAGSTRNYKDLSTITELEDFRNAWAARKANSDLSEWEGREEPDPEGDAALDQLFGQTKIPSEPPGDVDVRALWTSFVESEEEFSTLGTALSNSTYRTDLKRHVVPFELEAGTLDYSLSDTVGVLRQERRGNWRRVGVLDIRRSSKDSVVIESSSADISIASTDLVRDGQLLKFTSHFEEESLRRRKSAITRVASGNAGIKNLMDAFAAPVATTVNAECLPTDEELDRYGLNSAQAEALKRAVSIRPLGLVQGPPGTGKTKFIAALVHYALHKKLIRNVLIASQSHEAVNNATEAVLRLFSNEESTPSLMRVGNEAVVSEPLMPFHTQQLEALFKDRFQAEFHLRLENISKYVGDFGTMFEPLMRLQLVIRPLITQYRATAKSESSSDNSALKRSLQNNLQALGLSFDEDQILDSSLSVSDLFGNFAAKINLLQPTNMQVSPAALLKFRQLVELSQDFLSTESSARRSFEPFLAGTRQLVSGTCVGLGRPSLGLTASYFDLVIVDEAARCTSSELAVPLQTARWAVLVGDHNQLEPLHSFEVVSRVRQKTGLPESDVLASDFERMFDSFDGTSSRTVLDTQYRMLPPIGRLVSRAFYNGKLKSGRTEPILPPDILPTEFNAPIIWAETDGFKSNAFQSSIRDSSSLINSKEADVVLALLKSLDECEPFRKYVQSQVKFEHLVGIICMYAGQKELLRQKVAHLRLSESVRRTIKIDTVDSYQGKENPIVIVSLVRNNRDLQENGQQKIAPGFLAKTNRINVAMSRAMDQLIIVGARHSWPEQNPLSKLSDIIKGQEVEGNASTLDVVGLLKRDSAETEVAK